jgi:hypothetical protein
MAGSVSIVGRIVEKAESNTRNISKDDVNVNLLEQEPEEQDGVGRN